MVISEREYNTDTKKLYEEPKVTIIESLSLDIITESHLDPDMGEWDTE